jgi:hypothetical protein
MNARRASLPSNLRLDSSARDVIRTSGMRQGEICEKKLKSVETFKATPW